MSRYINADEAIKVMACEMYAEAQSQGYDVDGVEDFIPEATAWMNDIPTIEPKRGEWITIDTKVVSVPVYWNEEQRQSDERGAGIQEKCKCSACGWITNFVGYKKLGVNKSFNFCPNCGADMREREGE